MNLKEPMFHDDNKALTGTLAVIGAAVVMAVAVFGLVWILGRVVKHLVG